MRKMAKLTALRLSEKPKKDEKAGQKKPTTLSNPPKNISNNIVNRRPDQQVKLPKVQNSSAKNIDLKKPT